MPRFDSHRLSPALAAWILCVAACGAKLPPKDVNEAIAPGDPGYEALQARLRTVDALQLTDAQQSNAKDILRRMADHSKSLNKYVGMVERAHSKNEIYQSTYGWLNGFVSGLGSLLAAIDKDRDWGPVAGAAGAIWAGVGLTLQKAFVEPKVGKASEIVSEAAKVRDLFLAARDRWEELVNALEADQPAKYAEWVRAANEADAAATRLLGLPAPVFVP